MELRNLAGREEYKAKVEEHNKELVTRHEKRQSSAVKDGRLICVPIKGDSVTDRRNNGGPGFRTENYHADVKH